MLNFAIIKDGKVVNVAVAEADYAAEQGWVALTDNAGIGWDYANGQFVDNRPTPEIVVPATLTKEELLIQLNALSAQIQALE
jgi:hypothetical protein